jgi:hypothetical protein
VLRAGLVLAAGAASLAVTSGAAQADSGLSGTLDHVSSTVKHVTGGGSSSSSHSSSHASSSSSRPSTKASSHRSSSRPTSSTRVSVRRNVVRPVVRPVVRTLKPVVRTVHRTTKPVVRVQPTHEKRAEDRAAQKRAQKAAQKKRVQQVDRAVDRVTSTVLHASRPLAANAPSAPTRPPLATVDLPTLGVAVDLPVVDLGPVALPSLGVDVSLPGVSASVQLPGVGVGVGVDLPAVPAHGVRPPATTPLPTATAASVMLPPTTATDLTSGVLAPPRPHAPLVQADPYRVPSDAYGTRSHVSGQADGRGHTTPRLTAAVSLLAVPGTSGVGTGLVPDGSAQAGAPAPVVPALAVAAGIPGLTALHGRPAHARSGQALELLRQPGFSPD